MSLLAWLFRAWLLIVFVALAIELIRVGISPWLRQRSFIRRNRSDMANPQNAEVRFNLAQVFFRGGRYKKAKEMLEQAIQVASQNRLYPEIPYRFLLLKGNVLSKAAEWENAITAYKQALSSKAELGYEAAFRGIGIAFMRLKRWKEAEEFLKRALAESESELENYFRLAQVYDKLGEKEKKTAIRKQFSNIVAAMPRFVKQRKLYWKFRFALFP